MFCLTSSVFTSFCNSNFTLSTAACRKKQKILSLPNSLPFKSYSDIFVVEITSAHISTSTYFFVTVESLQPDDLQT